MLLIAWAVAALGVGAAAAAPPGGHTGLPASAEVDLVDLVGLLQADLQHNAFAKLFATEDALRRAGFASAQVVPNAQGDDVAVTATPSPRGPAPAAAADVAARVVWTSFGDSFGGEIVTIPGQAPRTYDHAQLVAAFGPRPPGFDQDGAGADLVKTTLAAGVLLLDAIGLLVALVHAVRRTVRWARRLSWPAVPGRSSLLAAGTMGLYAAGVAGVVWAALWLAARA